MGACSSREMDHGLRGFLEEAWDIVPPCHSQGGKRRKRGKGSRGTQLCDQELRNMQGQMAA